MERLDPVSTDRTIFPAEWYPQSGIMLTWPNEYTDWRDDLPGVIRCYVQIARKISERQQLIIVGANSGTIRKQLKNCDLKNIKIYELPYNDTWARDHGPLFVFKNDRPVLLDFRFNGWGGKFPADLDDQVCGNLWKHGAFDHKVKYEYVADFVLEGGSVESNGAGTLMTTAACLLAETRNFDRTKEVIEAFLTDKFGLDQILWLNHGALEGDDTDSHVDTLARFCAEQVITYVACDDEHDGHFASLKLMEEELQQFRTKEGYYYELVPLPMATPIFDDAGARLPATYANFLIMNDVVLMPFYKDKKDEEARERLQTIFPNKSVVGIDCRPLIKQHGSLHCITMQFPKGVL